MCKSKKRLGSQAYFKGFPWTLLLIACCILSSLFVVTKQSQNHLGQFSASLSSFVVKTKVANQKLQGPWLDFLSANNSFPGARDWYDHWTHASSQDKDSINPAHIHDRYVASEIDSCFEAATEHISKMKQRYESVDALPDFYTRGIGWIQDRLGMVLTVVIAGNSADDGSTGNTTILHSGPTSIFIVDVIGEIKCGSGKGDKSWIDKQPPLSMWVRANGPEIFAGTALPHPWNNHRCAWRYDFEPRNAGAYSIYVKVLTFDGFQDFNSSECGGENLPSRNDMFDGQVPNQTGGQLYIEKLESMNTEAVRELAEQGNYSHHRGVSGFKVYGHREVCCEACTKARNCRMWSSPGAGHYDNCELYFDQIEHDLDFLDRGNGRYLGRDVSYAYMRQVPSDFPNIRRKLSHRKLAVNASEFEKIWPIKETPLKGSPRAGAFAYFIGCGWSSFMAFESPCHYPSDDLVFGSGKKMQILPDDSPPSAKPLQMCTLDNEKFDRSNGRWVRHPYPDDSECLEMVSDTTSAKFVNFRPTYYGDRNPECWHRHDLTQLATSCAETGCQHVIHHRWMTDLKKESKWFGKWEPYECAYKDMGDDMIQQCVDKKKISSIVVKGASISGIVDDYMVQKLERINMTNVGDGTLSIVLDTLAMPHKLWNNPIDEHRKDLEKNFPDVTTSDIEHYWLTGFYLTSEREPHVLLDRSLQYSKMAWDILSPKGYKMINGFDLTAAFAFDTDGQADGLHITGPPIVAIITKFFHHICHDALS